MTDPSVLRLLTFNCLWNRDARARLAVLGGWLERSDVDVACLQEVIFRGRVGLLRSLVPSFPHVVYRPMAIGVRGGLVTLSRWPVVRQRSLVYRRRGPRRLERLWRRDCCSPSWRRGGGGWS